MTSVPDPHEYEALRAEVEDLRETLRAIRSGEVDAIVVDGARVYALETAERPYRVFLEAMQEGAVTILADGTIVYCNQRFATMLGASSSRILGCRFAELAVADDAHRVVALIERAAEGRAAAELGLRGPDGPLAVQVSVSRLVIDAQVSYCLVVTDQTAAKRAELALREARDTLEQRISERTAELSRSEQRFRSLVTATTAIVWATDAAGRFAVPQWSWQVYTGQPWDRHRGMGWMEGVHPDDREQVAAKWAAALEGRSVYENSVRIWHAATRTWRHCRVRAVPVPDTGGGVREWIGSCEDVHAARTAEEALRASEQRLKEDDRRKDEFIATLAHELRNPLAPIRNAAKVLERADSGTSETRWAHEVIGRQVAQMARLLDDLLEVSRITQNKLELQRERVLLADIVRSAVETSQPLIRDAGCELEVSLPVEAVELDADPTRLSQVLLNLLNNAAKYNSRGGRIGLKARRLDGEVEICVTDDGIGIAPDVMPTIFDMFMQADGARQRSRGGLGIGLALVRRLVEMHGGSVQAESGGAGKGACFTVRMPAPDVAAHAADRAPAAAAAGPKAQHRILVADDNTDAADSLSLLLSLDGHDVRTVYAGDEAVEEALAFAPDVVLLDIGMPGLTGYEAARIIRERANGSRPTLIALTGWGQAQDKRHAAEAGFDLHFTKPVDFESLVDALRRVPPRR